MSNTTGEVMMYSSNNRFGINQPAPNFTLDVNGDINFSGKIYQAGAIFSGWNSNAFGNYINSNAALQGPATSNDVLLLYAGANGCNLSFSMSNTTGEASFWSSNSSVGLGTNAPLSTLDVAGDVRGSSGLYALSNNSALYSNAKPFFQSMRAPSYGVTTVAAGIGGDVVVTGSTWCEALFAQSVGQFSRIALVGSAAGVASNAALYDGRGATLPALGAQFTASNWPVLSFNPFLWSPTGDVATSNLYATGTSMVRGSHYVDGSLQANQAHVKTLKVTGQLNMMSNATLNSVDSIVNYYLPFAAYAPSNLMIDATAGDAAMCNLLALGSAAINGGAAINGPMTANDASMRTVVIRGNTSNFYTNVASTSNTTALYTPPVPALPYASSNYVFVTPYSSASSYPDPLNASKSTTLVLEVEGDAAVDGTLGLLSNLYVGGTAFFGPGANSSSAKAAWKPLMPAFTSSVALDVQGHVTLEGSVQVSSNLVINASTAINGSLTGNHATMRTMMVRGSTSNFAFASSNSTGAGPQATTWPHAASNPVFQAAYLAAGSNRYDNLNSGYPTTVLFGVDGDAAIEGSIAMLSNVYVGGAIFIGSNVNASAPALPSSLIATLPYVVLDCQGDVVFENGAYVNSNLLVGSNIGVGTPAPQYPVDVQQSISGISLNCAAKVTASEFAVYSDRRIKTDILYGDVDEYLDAINQLAVCSFSYLDPTDKGAGVKTGFIAQDVEAVLPSCVVSVVGYLPNVMQDAAILGAPGRFQLSVQLPPAASTLASAGSIAIGTKIKCRYDGAIVLAKVLELTPDADGSGCVALFDVQCELPQGASTIFVVGTEVQDFKMLNYEQINTIAIGAIQAQQKTIESQAAAIAALQASVATLLGAAS